MNDKEVKELLLVIKCLTLQMVDVREELASLRLALIQKQTIDAGDFQAAQDLSKTIWEHAREEIRKIGTAEARSLDDTLENIQGPMQ
jgi:hypothetical protein